MTRVACKGAVQVRCARLRAARGAFRPSGGATAVVGARAVACENACRSRGTSGGWRPIRTDRRTVTADGDRPANEVVGPQRRQWRTCVDGCLAVGQNLTRNGGLKPCAAVVEGDADAEGASGFSRGFARGARGIHVRRRRAAVCVALAEEGRVAIAKVRRAKPFGGAPAKDHGTENSDSEHAHR